MRDINLLPEDVKSSDVHIPVKNIKPGSSVKFIILSFAVIIFMGATLVAPKIFIKKLEERQSSIEMQLTMPKYLQVKAVNAQLNNINTVLEFKKNVINTIDNQSYPVSEMLSILKHAAPEASMINSFDYNTNSLNVSISMNDLTQIAEFISNVKKSEYLKPSASMKDLSINKDSALQFSFDVGRKDGK